MCPNRLQPGAKPCNVVVEDPLKYTANTFQLQEQIIEKESEEKLRYDFEK
jgi:hypothetical protein